MRKIIVGAQVSMDGVMQAPGAPTEDPTRGFKFGGWVMPYFDQAFSEELDRVFKKKFDLLLGRRTYEIFAAYWPYQDEDAPHGGIAKLFNGIKKYPVSHSGEVDTNWAGSVLLRDIADVKRLKQEDGPNLVTQGSTDLVHALLANDLVDAMSIFTVPVVLGGGKKLFAAQTLLFAQVGEEARHAIEKGPSNARVDSGEARHDELEHLFDGHSGVGAHHTPLVFSAAPCAPRPHPLVDEGLHMRRELVPRVHPPRAGEMIEVNQRVDMSRDGRSGGSPFIEQACVAFNRRPEPQGTNPVHGAWKHEVAFQHNNLLSAKLKETTYWVRQVRYVPRCRRVVMANPLSRETGT
jgi:dihydrofolate reductase